MNAACRFVQRHAVWFWASALFVGLAFQDLARLLNPVVFPFAVLTMLLTLLRVDWADVLAYLRRPGLWLVIGVGAMVGAPLVVAAVLSVLGIEGNLANGVLVVSAAPPVAVNVLSWLVVVP